MELRRALLLFAIVLGLAAVATSVSRSPEPRERAREPAGSEPVASPRPGPSGTREIAFAPQAEPSRELLEAGRSATVVVEVEEAGQVEIEGLGLTSVAEPLTPARFDVLASRAATHRVLFRPAGTAEATTVGTLEIGPAIMAR